MKKILVVLLALCSFSLVAQQKPVAKKAVKKATLKATGATHQTSLSWAGAIQPPTVQGYNVYKGATSGGENSVQINTSLVTTTNYIDLNVVPLQTAFYIVKSVCSSCTPTLSVPSNEVSFTTPGDGQPNPPTGLNGVAQ